MEIGEPIDETGLLVRSGAHFWLHRDLGGQFLLELRRVPVDEVEKRVRVIGIHAGGGLIEVEGIQLAG
jgi:hypothetical protein